MNCGSIYLCSNVDVRFEWGVSFSFLIPFQENCLSGFELVFFGYFFVFAVSFCDFFVPAGSLGWVVVKSGTDCLTHEEFIGRSS